MRVRIARPVVVGIVAVLVMVSCGGGDDEDALSEEQLVQRANEICATHARAIEDAARARFGASREVPSADEIEDLADNTVIPEMDRMLDELEDLKPPDDEKEDFEDFISETRRALDDEIKEDPSSILSEQAQSDPFIEANEKADDVGATECAGISQRIRTAAAARPPR